MKLFSCILAIGLTFSAAVRADLDVFDPITYARIGQELQTINQTLQQAQQIKQETTQTVASLTNIPANLISQVSGLLSSLTMNPLGGNIVGNLNSVLRGNQGVGTCTGGSGYLAGSTYGTPTGTDFAGQMLSQTMTRNAGVQACANQVLTGTQTQLQQLPGLMSQLQSARTESEATAISGRIQAQIAIIMAQIQQLEAVMHMNQMQRDMQETAYEQKFRVDSQQLYQSISGGNGVSPVAPPQTFTAFGN